MNTFDIKSKNHMLVSMVNVGSDFSESDGSKLNVKNGILCPLQKNGVVSEDIEIVNHLVDGPDEESVVRQIAITAATIMEKVTGKSKDEILKNIGITCAN